MPDIVTALRAARTLTQEQVDHLAFVHDMDDPAPEDIAEVHGRHAEFGSAER